jgi:tetratricopeptide (TPR) repeat protein
MMTAPVNTEEQEQILQTIEMFEVIVQSNPGDCQSLEILKEAYWKLSRQTDALNVTRRLADAYMQLGQYSSALLEYEGILQKDPDNAEVVALLGEVEAKLHQPTHTRKETRDGSGMAIDVDFGSIAVEDPTLMTINQTRKEIETNILPLALDNDGNEPLAKFLVQHKLAPEEAVNTALDRVRKINKTAAEQSLSVSLIDEVTRTNTVEIETLLCGILDRTKFAYIPLDSYDVDRQIVKMLPESLTLGRLIVPFDLMSRTVMVAMANPFDALGKEAVQQLFDYNIQWHLAAPAAISKVLRDTYRLPAH